MKIGLIVPFVNISFSGGVTVQGRMWKEGLDKFGNVVDLIDPWRKFDWNSYDYFILLRFGKDLLDYVQLLKQFPHPKLVSAPIIDYHLGISRFKFVCRYAGNTRLRLYHHFHDLYTCKDDFSFFLVRSEFESKFLTEGMGVSEDKVYVLPLSFRIPLQLADNIEYNHKENFCFHSSRLAFLGKNVERLIKAAIKYKFPLVLGGALNGYKEEQWLNELIKGHSNIKYVGYLTDNELYSYYRRAKVFALPSIVEGVGMVALEAAVFGCDIVLTNIGAPKEYFNGMVELVNPYDIDSIGESILKCLNGITYQPHLRNYILKSNNMEACIKALENVLVKNLVK